VDDVGQLGFCALRRPNKNAAVLERAIQASSRAKRGSCSPGAVPADADRPPANRHRAVGFTPKQWHYVFTNTFSEDESQALYERYHVPASGAILWGIVLANLEPGHQATWVDYKNDSRAPLLFISGGEDHLMPPSVQRSNAEHYKSNTITEVKEYEGRAHLLPAQEGWEEVADYALEWALANATQPAATPADPA
jgi:pimeloyl-ACP methyl ester carboxylesterase